MDIKRANLFIIVVFGIIVSVAGFSFLIIQQENILRKYFIIQPQERVNEFKASLADSLSKYFIKENKAANLSGVTDYIRRYGKTSLFELIFVFKDKDGSMKQVSKIGVTTVSSEVLSTERVYPVVIDNGKIDGYLMIIIKEAGVAELKEGLGKYKRISYSVRLLFLFLIAALATIALYHNYSAKMRLARDIAEMKASNDGLTSLHTHEHFMKVLDIEVEKLKIYNTPLALLMMDIDQFKTFNDKYGHLAGDRVLQEVAKIIKSNTRATDILARYGGEEFAAIIPYVVRVGEKPDQERLKNFLEEVKNVTERIRKSVEDCDIEFVSNILKVTISIGVVFCYKRAGSITSGLILQRADRALYKAKSLGRNRVYIDYETSR